MKELELSWYQKLLNDLKKLEFTGIVLTKWNIGKRILEDFDKFGKPEYGQKKVESIARDLKISSQEIWRCIQFAKKYSHGVRELENKSWHYVANKLLPDPREDRIRNKIKKYERLADEFEEKNIVIYKDDFKKVAKKIENNSVDLILTDPPYPEEYLPLWKDLFNVANQLLKPSKFLVCYANHQNLDKIFRLENKLIYYWTFKLDFTLKPLAKGRNLIATWKPVLIFQKPPFKKFSETIEDNVKEITPFNNSQRDMHEENWGQSIGKIEYLIDKFSAPNDLIFEPFAGTGTTLLAAKNLKRRCIGSEIEKKYINLIKGRLV